jgi:hypothetical protein
VTGTNNHPVTIYRAFNGKFECTIVNGWIKENETLCEYYQTNNTSQYHFMDCRLGK